ncbi:CDP-2,3-bis-(O-geranylgeranyl)-sn-glycerol synthase [uncultured Methanobrevibacter sp.]|uniref:CDP-2,3-bis-(O-geranylgeranyl)-sn-glycerol synthase n=1 Tax=uncultured Methanobrevibacter sp. TaxID=253161 RepID=UPI00263884A7|nr:CDP-2,3-bis-(O-geranylgeranyl)-sn-glycerol synthase [uncultured Methanobrevibacter sp.]
MVDNTQIFIMACITILYFILPAYASNGSALIFGGGLPLDFKKTDKKGNPWIGNGVTWKGLIGGTIVGTLVGMIQGLIGPYILENFGEFIYTPICTNLVEGILIGFLLGFGAMVGDAIGSFLKRRIGLKRGKPAPILDQIDFLIVALLFSSLVVNFSITFVIIAIVLTLIIHVVANTIAYLIGIKDVWY